MGKFVLTIAKQFLLYLILCIGVFLMARSIAEHFSFGTNVGFLAAKQAYLPITTRRIAFYIHVFSSLFTLMAGAVQFSSYIHAYHPGIHRLVGKLYILDVLFINVPAGLILAIYANGFLPSKIAFVILDILWFWFTLQAYLAIRRRDIGAHKRFMIRSYALTFSAVTLRTWRLVLSSTFGIDPVTLYMIDAWLGFVPNALFAEWLVRRPQQQLVSAESRKSQQQQ